MLHSVKKILVISPHPDDEILGVGGTMALFSSQGYEISVLTVAAHMPPLYTDAIHQQTIDEAKRAHKMVGVKNSIFLNLPAVLLGEIRRSDFNGKIHKIVTEIEPDVVFIPYPDRHVDHRLIFDAAMVSTRPVGVGQRIQMVAAYETISETHWNAPHIEPNFTPNWCVDISTVIDTKIKALECYKSQLQSFPNSRSPEALKALSLFRGSQAGMGYAEGFHIVRMSTLNLIGK